MALRKTVRWVVLVVAAVVIALVAVLTGVLFETGDEGTSDLEMYIGEQIRAAVNDQLNPQLEFTKPDYQYPKTVTIENVRITAPDPFREGRVIDIVRIRRATLELSEIPSIGEPLLIEKVRLEKPEIRLIANGPLDGLLIGFSDLLKKKPGDSETTEPSTTEPATTEPSTTKLTDVFRIRLIELVGGVIEFDPRTPDGKAMHLDGINTSLVVELDQEGWYTLNTKIMREPIFTTAIVGRFNINDALVKIESLDLQLLMGKESIKTLPPQLQVFADEYQLRGALSLKAAGELDFNDMTRSSFNVDMDMRDGYATFSDYRVKIDKWLVKCKMSEQVIDLSHFEIRALKGVVFSTGRLELAGIQNASIDFEAEHLDLSDLDRALAEATGAPVGSSQNEADPATKDAAKQTPPVPPADETTQPSPLRGTLEAKFKLHAPLTALTSQAGGTGYVKLQDGRLIRVSVLKEFEQFVSSATSVLSGDKAMDQLYVVFKLEGDHAVIQNIDLRTPAMAIRGKGTVGFDGKLNLALNGGPLQKVQGLLGAVGDFTIKLTNKLAEYRVTGTVQEPEFDIQVAPGLFD